MEKKDLKPAGVFHYFEEICQVPRPSKKEEKIIAYLKAFGEKHKLETKVDEAGNVLIKKPATPGMENRKTVVLQSHIDMVCDMNIDVMHVFLTVPIESEFDGEWLKAKGTTLGADYVIGVATELAILADDSIEHGPIECLFTVDEETGLTGAFALKEGFMNGDILLNLDSEDEGEIFIGCAGGVDTLATFRYKTEAAPEAHVFFRVRVSDLSGGHSGDDIDKGRMNSNKLVARLLWNGAQRFGLRLSRFDGGNLRNAIPREAYAVFAVPSGSKAGFEAFYKEFAGELAAEAKFREPNFMIGIDEVPASSVIDAATQRNLLYALVGLPNGVIEMSLAMTGLVETSTNLASVKFEGDDRIVVTTSQRSSVESAKVYASQMIESVFALAGAEVSHSEGYPGWAPNPQSKLLEITVASYENLFGVKPKVRAIHAGLECGLFLEKYPHLEMVSFGPTLRGVHSPDERLEIATIPKFWDLLADILKKVE